MHSDSGFVKLSSNQNRCYICSSTSFGRVLSLDGSDSQRPASIFRCKNCGLEFLWPIPKETTRAQFYDDSYYQEGYIRFEEEREQQFTRLLDRLEDRGVSGPLLDVGCGMGILVHLAREKGWDAEGVDTSSDACRIAEERYGISLYHGDITKVDSPGHWNVAILWQVLSHTLNPRVILSHSAELLAPGGYLIMTFPNWRDPRYRLAMWQTRLQGINAVHIPSIIWHFKEEHLKILANQAGLNVDEIVYEPVAVKRAFGWKRGLIEKGFEAWRRVARQNEEIHMWCRKPL